MSTDIAVRTDTLAEMQEYAKALAPSDLLPAAYRGKPANVLLAIESGKALGIPPIQAINQIHVINGSPALSANLMRALVQRAGHKIRVVGDEKHAVATLIRKDDPDFEHTSTWDLTRAKVAGLTGGNWTKHPNAMLKARATAEVCRSGAADVLMGFDYLEDELLEARPQTVTVTRAPGEKLREAAGLPPLPPAEPEAVDAEIVADVTDSVELIRPQQMRHMQALFGELGVTDREDKMAFVAEALGHENTHSATELTVTEASAVIDLLKGRTS